MEVNTGYAGAEARLRQINDTALEREDIEAVLAAYAERNGVPAMTFDGDGVIELSIKDELPLALLHMPPFPGVMASATLPEGLAARDDLVRDLLRANRSWAATAGVTFAKLPGGDDYVLCRMISLADRDDEAFERAFLGFAAFALDQVREIDLWLDLPPAGAGAAAARAAGTERGDPAEQRDDAAAFRPRPSEFA